MRQIMCGEATDAQIGAYITGLRLAGESPAVISGSARAMREQFTSIQVNRESVVDTCGTGGDGAHTINISTAAAFVAAGAGVAVAKHGNRSVSSICGSADVLEALGVGISVPPETMRQCLNEIGIAFLFAPLLHPAMKYAIGPRREIGIRTIFNILGPLANPASAQRGILGVFSRDMVDTIATAALGLSFEHFFVVHGDDGLDEITTTTTTHVGEVCRGAVRFYDLDPRDFGIPYAGPEDLRGGNPEQNAAAIRAVLEGRPGAHRDVILLNAAAAIVAGQGAQDLNTGLVHAAASIDSGEALQKLEALIRLTAAGE
jgi:anthranilate phosphoribosyltransferase